MFLNSSHRKCKSGGALGCPESTEVLLPVGGLIACQPIGHFWLGIFNTNNWVKYFQIIVFDLNVNGN